MEHKGTIWTIGHSNRPVEKLVEMLRSFAIETVVDIRSYPGSRKNPQYNSAALAQTLHENGIGYTHLDKLGGRRTVDPGSTNMRVTHPAFRAYADHMETLEFREGIAELTAIASRSRTAIMCAEAVWWRCHRSMVSDYLKSTGWTVLHISDVGKAKEHPYTGGANIVDGKLSYKGLL